MAIQPSFAGESPTVNDIAISVLAGSFTLVSRRNACQLKSAKASPDTIFELDFTFGQIDYSSLPHKEEVLAYWNICDSSIDLAVDALDITNPDCGFFWYMVSKI